MAELNYTNIDRPFDSSLFRTTPESLGEVQPTSGMGAIYGQATNQETATIDYPSQLAENVIDGSSISNLWIKTWIKSQNYLPGSQGFLIDGLTGNVEFGNGKFRGDITGASGTFSGTITATTGSIGGFNIGSDYLRDVANSFGLASTVTGGDDVRFWAGDTFANRATAPVRITEAGVLTASNIIATGTINAQAGYLSAGVYVDTVNGLVCESEGINVGTAGHIRGGQTAYNTGTGFFLGYSISAYKFSIGVPTGDNLTWDGASLAVTTSRIQRTVTVNETVTAGQAMAISDGNAVADNPIRSGSTASDSIRAGSPENWVAKKFTTTSSATAISKVILKIRNDSGSNDGISYTITISIRASDGTSPTGSDIDGQTATVSYQLNANTTSAELTATFGTPPTVSGSTTYFVCVRQDDSSKAKVIISNEIVSAGDRKSADAGSNWSASTSNYQYYITPYETGMAAGQYRLASAADTDFRYSSFIGFATENITSGNSGKVNMVGINSNQSGLTAGLPYYLSNTNGAIASTAGTNSKKIGTALSATEILILNS